MAARRHFLMTLRKHLHEEAAELEDSTRGRRAKFLLDHLAMHVPRVDDLLVEDFEAAMRGGAR